MIFRTKEEWLALFASHEASGLSALQFCKENNLCPRYFSLRKRQLLQLPSKRSTCKTAGFVKAIVSSPMGGGVMLRYGGCELRFPETVSTTWLSALIKSLV